IGERLFTKEFYQNTLKALTENGVMACQSESPVVVPEECKRIANLLNSVFPHVQQYTACVPTYPGGQWTWTFCSKGLKPLENIDSNAQAQKTAAQLEKDCKFYNRELHKAVFVLPNYVKEVFSNPAGV